VRVAASSAESNVGRKRRHNEDAYVSKPPVFAVADGMGGAQAGEVASALAAATVTDTTADPHASAEERVVSLIKAANLRVHQRASSDAAASGMGTTMTVAMLSDDGRVTIGHVGDSRAYRLRNDHLEQLTEDHSLVAELVRRGELTPEEAAVHPQRSVITRALGTEPDVDVDVFSVQAEDGDVYLLCSDGLSTMVDSDTIAEILRRNRRSLDSATHALIKAANDRGGDDNITAIIFTVADGDAPEAETLLVPVPAIATDPDEEDTLHPEDNVRLPDEIAAAPPAEVTRVLSAAEVAQALEQAQREARSGEEHAPDLTVQHPAVVSVPPHESESAVEGAHDDQDHGDETEPEPEAEKASPLRIAVALLVIVVLAALIVLLVLNALPR
jgi:protein phosphatase